MKAYKVKVYELTSDVMEPTILKGYGVIADYEDDRLEDGKVYLFRLPEGEVIIRRAVREGDRWLMVPDNPEYPPLELTDDVVVIGRAVKSLPPVEVEDVD